jgi:riboflavin synthase
MFTGITVSLGEVLATARKGASGTLVVGDAVVVLDASPGHSVAVNGVCLTLTALAGGRMSFDVSHETLAATNLGELGRGSRVNLESAMRPVDRLGGHFVTGHVDAVGRISSKKTVGGMLELRFEAPSEVLRYVVKKGSIAVDGISLTVADVHEGGFSTVIIPHTAGLTTLGAKGRGDSVNMEADIIGKYVERFVAGFAGAFTGGGNQGGNRDGNRGGDLALLNKLKEEGFIR